MLTDVLLLTKTYGTSKTYWPKLFFRVNIHVEKPGKKLGQNVNKMLTFSRQAQAGKVPDCQGIFKIFCLFQFGFF